MGVVPNKKSLVQTEKLSASSFCRRRLAVVMMRIKMAETLKEACTFIEQVSRVWDVNAYQATVTHHQDSGGGGWTGWGYCSTAASREMRLVGRVSSAGTPTAWLCQMGSSELHR